MKKVIVLHGTGETPESFWYPYLKEQMSSQEYEVVIPQLPNTDDPKLAEQMAFALDHLTFDEETILIGHSSGVPLILAILEKIPTTIKQAIMVAGYASALKDDAANTKNLKDHFDWEQIKEHCQDFVFINAVNDPWGANDTKGREMFDRLGGTLIINNEGHMGSESFNQPYKEFPFLLKLID